MSDIIDQLRERTENIDVIFEAADEIESLRSELEQVKVDKVALQKVAFTAQEMAKEIARRAEAEAASLRSELEQARADGEAVARYAHNVLAPERDAALRLANDRLTRAERAETGAASLRSELAAKDARIAELEAKLMAIETHELRDWEDYEAIKELARNVRGKK